MLNIVLGINNATDADFAIVAAVFIAIPILVVVLIVYGLKNSNKPKKNKTLK